MEDLVKKLEADMQKAEKDSKEQTALQTELEGAKKKLASMMKTKEDYLKDHPEDRKSVFPTRKRPATDTGTIPGVTAPPPIKKADRNVFNSKGLPRHPERSVWFDPVFIPSGMPPPGQLYREKGTILFFFP